MSDTTKAVFLSYASQDAEAARRIADALRAAGVEVWFDQNELVGGDAWDAKIRGQISSCALFVPVISTNTQARLEGYFRREWKQAAARTHDMADEKAFLLPVVIDDTRDAEARVPAEFKAVQWTRLKGGETPPAFCARVKKLLDSDEEALAYSRPPVDREGDAPAGRRGRRSKIRYVGMSIGLMFGLIYGLLPQIRAILSSARSDKEAHPTATQISPARELAERAQLILKTGSLTRAQLDTAGELCERARQLDPTDPIVWAVSAEADLEAIHPYGYDRTEERRRRAQERAARAFSLGPDLLQVRVTQARVFAHAVGTPTLLAEAEKILRELISSHPGDRTLVLELAEVLREQQRFKDAAKLFESINEFEIAGWSYHQAGEFRQALAAVERSPRSVTGLQLKALLQLGADEDLDEVQQTVSQLQPSELLAEMPAAIALKVAYFRREPDRMLEIAQGLTGDYLDSNAFSGPRQYWTGLAHELAGRPVQAESEWRAALAVVEARRKTAPDDRPLLLWSAWLHAALKDPAEAEARLARSQKLAGLDGDTMVEENTRALLRLRHKEALLAGSARILQSRRPNWEIAHAEMRFSPECDFQRDDPRFVQLLRDHLPAGAKPFDDPKPAAEGTGPGGFGGQGNEK